MIIGYVLLNSFGALAIKSTLNKLGAVRLDSLRAILVYFRDLFKWPMAILGFLAIMLSAFVWMAALSRLEITIAYPAAVALNFFVVVLTGSILFRESITLAKIFGIVLIFISIFLLAKK
jgi:multidrug transporter EmrE-like cation transporter